MPDSHSKEARPAQSLIGLLWGRYEKMLERHPLATKAYTAFIINILGDVVSQRLVERRKGALDMNRVLRMGTVGIHSTPLIHYWYSVLDKLVPAETPNAGWIKLALDQGLFSPFMTIFFFVFMRFLEKGSFAGAGAIVSQNIVSATLDGLKLWPASQYINFNYVPPHLRNLFGNGIGFIWGIYLSYKFSAAAKL